MDAINKLRPEAAKYHIDLRFTNIQDRNPHTLPAGCIGNRISIQVYNRSEKPEYAVVFANKYSRTVVHYCPLKTELNPAIAKVFKNYKYRVINKTVGHDSFNVQSASIAMKIVENILSCRDPTAEISEWESYKTGKKHFPDIYDTESYARDRDEAIKNRLRDKLIAIGDITFTAMLAIVICVIIFALYKIAKASKTAVNNIQKSDWMSLSEENVTGCRCEICLFRREQDRESDWLSLSPPSEGKAHGCNCEICIIREEESSNAYEYGFRS